MTVARRYDISDYRLANWGRAMRRWKDPGLGFPKVSVYAKEYQTPVGEVWSDTPPPEPDDEDAQRVEDALQVMKQEGSAGYKRFLAAKIKWMDNGGNNTNEDVQRHLSKALGRRVDLGTVEEFLQDVRWRVRF